MSPGEDARRVVELAGHGLAGISLAHHRLHVEGLDEPFFAIGEGVEMAQCVDIVRGHGQGAVISEAGKVVPVVAGGGVRDLGGAAGAPVEAAFEGEGPDGSAVTGPAGVGHLLRVDVRDA